MRQELLEPTKFTERTPQIISKSYTSARKDASSVIFWVAFSINITFIHFYQSAQVTCTDYFEIGLTIFKDILSEVFFEMAFITVLHSKETTKFPCEVRYSYYETSYMFTSEDYQQ